MLSPILKGIFLRPYGTLFMGGTYFPGLKRTGCTLPSLRDLLYAFIFGFKQSFLIVLRNILYNIWDNYELRKLFSLKLFLKLAKM